MTNVFGSKFLRTLSPVDIALPEEGEEEEQGADEEPAEGKEKPNSDRRSSGGAEAKGSERKIWGMVSKAGEGVGRADNDRQFLYLNGRPVDLPKVTDDQELDVALMALVFSFCDFRPGVTLALCSGQGSCSRLCSPAKRSATSALSSQLVVLQESPSSRTLRVRTRTYFRSLAVHSRHQRSVAGLRNEAEAGFHTRPATTSRHFRRQRHP